VRDHNGQALSFTVYLEEEAGTALTRDAARRIAVNTAKLLRRLR
jgi:hypothetical protein